MKLSAYGIAMGVKQRRYPYEACLQSLADFCDEIIVAYDKRFDNPIIFTRVSPKVKVVEVFYDFTAWDFVNSVLTQARQACIGDWCYIYGMDEVFHKHQVQNLRDAVEEVDRNGGNYFWVRLICGVIFDLINVDYFQIEHSRLSFIRNMPNIIHKTSEYMIGKMDSPYWDGRYITKAYDDFSYYDTKFGKWEYPTTEKLFVESSYTLPSELEGDIIEQIRYKVDHYTHIWHYAYYHVDRKNQQNEQTRIWQDRTYGRSPDLDIDLQIQRLKETIILDPDRTRKTVEEYKTLPMWKHIDLQHPEYVQDWLAEMTIDAI